jgi:archaellum component FlaC
VEWLKWLFGLLKGNGAATAIEGFDRLTGRQDEWIDRIEKRLDDCDDDRAALHKRADECDKDREKLREALINHRTKINGLETKVGDLELRTNGT